MKSKTCPKCGFVKEVAEREKDYTHECPICHTDLEGEVETINGIPRVFNIIKVICPMCGWKTKVFSTRLGKETCFICKRLKKMDIPYFEDSERKDEDDFNFKTKE